MRAYNQRCAVFVTQWFPPEPATQAARIASVIRDSGYETHVVTGVPNYPSGTVSPGYRAFLVRTEDWNGIRVHRSPLYPSHDRNAVKRAANYVSWALSACVFSVRHFRHARIAVVYSSPTTAALPAILARRIYKTPYVLVVQDIWPDSVFASGFLPGRIGRLAHRILNDFVARSYRNAEAVAVISPGMRDLLIARGVPSEKVSLIYNSVDVNEMRGKDTPHSRESLGIGPDELVLMYAGNHGAAQNLSTLIRAAGRASSDRAIRVLLVGDGVQKAELQKLASKVAPGRVVFLDPVPRHEMASLMRLADVQVVSLADDPLFKITMPSKVQSILALGHPVWSLASGDVAEVVEKASAGVTSEPGDLPAAIATIERLSCLTETDLAVMAQSARGFYECKMSSERTSTQLRELLGRHERN